MIECPLCGDDISEDDIFYDCPYCGEWIDTDHVYKCESCGGLVDENYEEWVCPLCFNQGPREENEMVFEDDEEVCPECGSSDYDGYCYECGYPNNQGWIGENYG